MVMPVQKTPQTGACNIIHVNNDSYITACKCHRLDLMKNISNIHVCSDASSRLRRIKTMNLSKLRMTKEFKSTVQFGFLLIGKYYQKRLSHALAVVNRYYLPFGFIQKYTSVDIGIVHSKIKISLFIYSLNPHCSNLLDSLSTIKHKMSKLLFESSH